MQQLHDSSHSERKIALDIIRSIDRNMISIFSVFFMDDSFRRVASQSVVENIAAEGEITNNESFAFFVFIGNLIPLFLSI